MYISLFIPYLVEDLGSQKDTGTVVAVDTALVVVVVAAADNVVGFDVVVAAAAAVEAGVGGNRRGPRILQCP